MYAKTTHIGTLLVVVVVALSSCSNQATNQTSSTNTTTENVQQRLGEAFEERKGNTFGRKTQFENWATNQMNKAENQFQNLEQAFAKMNDSAESKWNSETKPELKAKMQAAKDKMAELKLSSKQAWPHVSRGFENAVESVRDGFDKASTEFKTAQRDNAKKGKNL